MIYKTRKEKLRKDNVKYGTVSTEQRKNFIKNRIKYEQFTELQKCIDTYIRSF